jgi:hypothetical protein
LYGAAKVAPRLIQALGLTPAANVVHAATTSTGDEVSARERPTIGRLFSFWDRPPGRSAQGITPHGQGFT